MSNGVYLTDEKIGELIACPKEFRGKPRDMVKVNQNYAQRFSVFSTDTDAEFSVFISYSQKMPQDFSIGLMYGDALLFRVNGFHGTTRKGFYLAKHHAAPHTHTLTNEDVVAGRKSAPSKIDETAGEYVDLLTARLYFFKRCGIMGYEKYFPEGEQVSMFD